MGVQKGFKGIVHPQMLSLLTLMCSTPVRLVHLQNKKKDLCPSIEKYAITTLML